MANSQSYSSRAERDFWRRLRRQEEKDLRAANKVLADMLYGAPLRKRRTRKVAP